MPGNRAPKPQIARPGSHFKTSRAAIARVSLCLTTLFIIGCASPGPPHPPSLNLPQPVIDLTAARVGDQVTLRWTAPTKNTDNLPIKGVLTAVICRASVSTAPSSAPTPPTAPASPTPQPPAARRSGSTRKPRPNPPSHAPTGCTVVLRLTVPSGPGTASDTLPPSLTADYPALLQYSVEILNSAGRSAGVSNPAFTAAGTAPPLIEDLRATAIPTGAMLEWRQPASVASTVVDLDRTNTTLLTTQAARSSTPPGPPPPTHSKAKPAKPPQQSSAAPPLQLSGQESPEVHLRAPESPQPPANSLAGTEDLTARFGPTYRYTAQRVRTLQLNGHTVEIRSVPSAPVTVTLRDIFPPAIPTGVAAIPTQSAAEASIDLSWQSNTEADLAGYNVYRRPVSDSNPSAPSTRLNPTPIPGPAFRDLTAVPGRRYAYTVTAIDTSGNESQPSPEVQESIPQP